jgi:hypothetical protein
MRRKPNESRDPYVSEALSVFVFAELGTPSASVYDALLFFFRRDREILERRRIHSDRNFNHPFFGRRENIPPPFVRNEIHKIHLIIDFELQSGLPYPWVHTTEGALRRPR